MNDTTLAGAAAPATGRLSGPEHYAAGQRLLATAERHITERPGDMRIAEVSAAAAQAHLTAALIAVQAALLADQYVGDGDHINEWRAATGAFPTHKDHA